MLVPDFYSNYSFKPPYIIDMADKSKIKSSIAPEAAGVMRSAELPWKVSKTITLTNSESQQLLDMIENPPPRNAKFKKAMADYLENSSQLPDGAAATRKYEADDGPLEAEDIARLRKETRQMLPKGKAEKVNSLLDANPNDDDE